MSLQEEEKRCGTLLAVCRSEKRGTKKTPQESVRLLPDYGIEGDAHAGHWHRQVSLLAAEKIREFREQGGAVFFGDFGENLVTEGIDLAALPVGTRIRIGEALLEVSQIGKACHSRCAIYERVGDCIMPREGIFAVVKEGGTIQPGDAAVITLSDRAAQGVYEDQSGPVVKELLEQAGYDVLEALVLPDGIEPLAAELCRLADQRQINLILTTGGTGLSPTGGNQKGIGPGSTRHWRSPARLQHALYGPGYALEADGGDPEADAHCESPGEPEGLPGGPCVSSPSAVPWTWNPAGDADRLTERIDMEEWNHFDADGNARMVDVSGKEVTHREAVAEGTIRVSEEVFAAICEKRVKKGDVLTVAQVAGIMGTKRTPELIPLCHVLNLTGTDVTFAMESPDTIRAVCRVKCDGKTGVEMEALTGVTTALLAIYDMCKAIDHRMVIGDIHLVEKAGGKSGHFTF